MHIELLEIVHSFANRVLNMPLLPFRVQTVDVTLLKSIENVPDLLFFIATAIPIT